MPHSWQTLCKNLRSPFLQHFTEIQSIIDDLTADTPVNIAHLQDMVSQIVQMQQQFYFRIDIEHQHLLDGFEQSVLLFASINEEDRVRQFETLNLIQELFNKLALSYFFNEDMEEEKKIQMPINDGTSTCSDFSDDNFEVEDFEAQVAVELFEQIRTQLQDQDIEQKCYQFQFTICQEELNIVDFFTDALQLQIKEYDVIIFLNYSGLLQKLMNYKSENQLEFFVGQLYVILNKIKGNEINAIIEQNCFELKYSRLSQRKFLRCKILSNIYTKIVYEKLDRWRTTQNIQEIHGENLKALRRFIVQNKAPLSRWEVSILSIQDVQVNYDNIVDKFQKLVIALSLPYDLLLQNFIILDKLFVNQQQFVKWFKMSSIPFTVKEISELFGSVSEIYGYYTPKGVKVIQRCDFYKFLDKIFVINQEADRKGYKYNDEITVQQYNKLLELKVNDLQQQLQIQNKQLESLKEQSVTSRVREKSITEESQQESRIKTEILHQAELNQIKNDNQQQMKVIEMKWKNKTKELLFELENKDKQIEHYRQQLEALIKELEWVKTERGTQ